MSADIKAPKKLIEVALPLDDINAAAAREKSIRHGHPSTLHLWWARRPLAAARAVLFAQMVNDPGGERGYYAGKTKAQADAEREKLFDIIRDLVKWENTNNEEVLERARAAIRDSWRETCALNKGKPAFDPEKLPAFHDPFAGGGAIPLEAQRLGLEAYASDLNPVAVLINKAMIEIPPRFVGRPPVGPVPEEDKQSRLYQDWSSAKGLAEDVRRYGQWMREEAERRIGHLYPKVRITAEMGKARPDLAAYVGKGLTVIAWLWARTVRSPNPAFTNIDVPLASTFMLSTKKGKEAYVEPVIEDRGYRFTVKAHKPVDVEATKKGTKLSRGANFRCLMSGTPISGAYIKSEGNAGRIGNVLMAAVVAGDRERVYVSPDEGMQTAAESAKPDWTPNGTLAEDARAFTPYLYGMKQWCDLFTSRQLVALTTLSDLIQRIQQCVKEDFENKLGTNIHDDHVSLADRGSHSTAYAEAISIYLAFSISKVANIGSSIASWMSDRGAFRETFARQAIQMTWDFAEANPFSEAGGSIGTTLEKVAMAIETLPASPDGSAVQLDAATQSLGCGKVVSADPPYYDNVPYADLSDFFYAWLRSSLKDVYPRLFATLAVPKSEELVVTSYRHGGKEGAEAFFLQGMTDAMRRLGRQAHPAFPVTVYYAFKQSEMSGEGGVSSTGWETFLEAIVSAGLSVAGTWPVRTEGAGRIRAIGANALASSIVLVCRRRSDNAPSISRRDFQRELREQMPTALDTMIGGTLSQSPIAPVDIAQAAIGPGMGIFSQYDAVLNQDGSPMSVHDALVLINRVKDEVLGGIGEADTDTGFCADWLAQYGWSTGPFGDAQVLAQGKGTTVDGVRSAGVIESGGGKVRLLKWREYPCDWNPKSDSRTPVWEACHHLIRALDSGGESDAGALLARMPERGESIRALAYHLYTLCERKNWAEDARSYNELIAAWHAIVTASHDAGHVGSQTELKL